jgi:predicted ATPase/DNA-binding CsgD family transcriptional regulator/predicted Ser/Thr protein kinase
MSNQQLISNRYRLGEFLSEGGMGIVYRGVDTQSDQPVAIKLLRPGGVAGQPDMVERFSREAEALRALNHPNIVKVLATVKEEDKQYIVMEYIGGGTLGDLLDREGQLTIARTLELALDLADALTRAHRLEIIHRDLKPANVLLADDGSPRLTDFGISRFGDARFGRGPRLTQTGMILGTVDYLSPEACQGQELDARADIWAFGVMLYEMLVGRRPFFGDSLAAVLTAILTRPVPDIEALRLDAPDQLVDLVYRMLTKELDARIPSVRLVGAELEAIMQDMDDDQHHVPVGHEDLPRFATPTPHPSGIPQHNLPNQTTPFIGREVELADLAELIADPDIRLITLLGSGGSGKTRLALESARALLPSFKNGVTFVSLAPLGSAENIIPAIAEAVGFQFFEHMEPRGQLIDLFREKTSLLVLDNFEHVLDGADLVNEILRAAPGVKVLATSREKLNLQKEVRFRIEGMDFPEETQPTSLEDASPSSAIRLFMQAAKRARPSFELDMDDLRPITRICRLVRGMPLGILLAAAWVEIFSPQEIVEEVNRSLDFLETEVSDIPERHRSIRAVFDSSWRQLSEFEREMFMKLAIFRSGFRREAAQAIAGASLHNLIGLVSKSLLHRDPSSGRYEVHELLRQYAEEQLEASGRAAVVRDDHCAYYLTFMENRLAEMLGPGQTKALDEIKAEYGNVRQAWRWAVDRRDYAAIDQALESLFVYSDMRSREHEGVELFGLARERLASQPGEGEELHPTWGRLLLPWYDLLLQSKGRLKDNQEIKSQAETSLALAQKRDDQLGIAYGFILLGHFTEPDEAIKMYEQALALCPRLDDNFWVRIRIGFCHRSLGEHHREIKAFQQSYERGREIGESEKMGWSLYNLAETEISLGDHNSASTHLREANIHFRKVGTTLGLVWTNIKLSLMMFLAGNIDEARSLVEDAQEIARDANRTKAIKQETLILLGFLSLIEQDYQKAQLFFEETLSAYSISPEASLGLTFIACDHEDYLAASRYFQDALQSASPYRMKAMIILCLPAAAFILRDDGEVERAVALLALASELSYGPKNLLNKWPMTMGLQAELRASLAPEEFDVAWIQGRALDLTETLTELAAHFHTEAHTNQPGAVQVPVLTLSGVGSLVEPLSEREIEVLQLLKTELSGPEIADELTISLNTFRFHTKNIYAKLQVSNRRSAVHRALELGI